MALFHIYIPSQIIDFRSQRAYVKSDEKENDLRLATMLVSGLLPQNMTWFSSVISWDYEAKDPYIALRYRSPDNTKIFDVRTNSSACISASMYKDNCWTELGNFAYDSEKQQRLIIRKRAATIPSGSISCDLQGENLDGYSFLCWIGSASSGWVGAPYIESVTDQSTKIFEGSKAGGLVLCWALYTKNPRVVEF